MSKRRNLKKEKASRNLAYARQFRKQSSRSFSRGQRSAPNQSTSSSANREEDK